MTNGLQIMERCYFLTVLCHGVLFFVDEWVFHRKRIFPLWERWGHPIDTFFVWLFLWSVWWVSVSDLSIVFVYFLGVVSSVLITKDEWVHAKLCEPAEHWLHALLFVLHPLVLFFPVYFLLQPHPLPFFEVSFSLLPHLSLYGSRPGTLPYLIQFFSTTMVLFYQVFFGRVRDGIHAKNATDRGSAST